ncbi:MAG: PilZ domain-containing protein [Thermodesulfobacteriota bacterium]|nr:PilZ domain-containing protein [Thermodesulfobacteriota bacterium]
MTPVNEPIVTTNDTPPWQQVAAWGIPDAGYAKKTSLPGKMPARHDRPPASSNVPLGTLINMINKKNFTGGTITIFLEYAGAYSSSLPGNENYNIHLSAMPMPCVDNRLDCSWASDTHPPAALEQITVTGFSFNDGENTYITTAPVQNLNARGVSFDLTGAVCYLEKSPDRRQTIHVTLASPHMIASGILTAVGEKTLRCNLMHGAPHSLPATWVGTTTSITITNHNTAVFSGKCRITAEYGSNTYDLKLIGNSAPRFTRRRYRSPRREMQPAPRIRFSHPLTGKPTTLEVLNLSGSGVAAASTREMILPVGMIVPQMTLYFPNSFKAGITAQIIHKRRDPDGGHVKYGMAILDMNADTHSRYLSLLKLADGALPMVSDIAISMNDLWSFFFETGFIYPRKYAVLGKNKQQFKTTYEQLYQQHLGISRHFILQDCGHILGHLSMLRLYSRAWMMHHHASREANRMAGIAVLKEAGRFINDSFSIRSVHMDYIFCYFRPENKFPRQVFGRLSENTPADVCSVDTFGYFIHTIPTSGESRLPTSWHLVPAIRKDLNQLKDHYENNSNGLMLKALDLTPSVPDNLALTKQFGAIGLTREQHLYSLSWRGDLKAVFMVNLSDPCLNMSGLAHCIHVFILDTGSLTAPLLESVLNRLLMSFRQSEMAVLLGNWDGLPLPINCSKHYNLWILNLDHADDYFRHVNRIFRFTRAETSASIITV